MKTYTLVFLSELNAECRSMLTATKECLESIKTGSVVSSHCSDARSRVRSLMTAAAAADRKNSGARSVDDELADMDRAIEEAASQIEVSINRLKMMFKYNFLAVPARFHPLVGYFWS